MKHIDERREPDEWGRTLEELYGLAPRGIQPGLERVREALERLGHPERAAPAVHVAGTNGKGSTSAMIARGVPDRRVGLFSSPHLHSLTERFRVAGSPVERDVVRDAWRDVRGALRDVPLTFFETITVLAFVIFEREGVELTVLETGLGGRLDATNVISRPLVTAITRVALDHQAWLGDTLASIASEKAGILKAGVPCVLGPQREEARAVVEAVAARVGAPLLDPSPVEGEVRLRGAHQRENAAIALAVLEQLCAQGLSVDPVGALELHWPGRLEWVPGSPTVLFDVAHNPSAARALAAHLRAEPPRGRRALVFGAMRDKDWPAMLSLLRPVVDDVVLTSAAVSRSQAPARMAGPLDFLEPDVARAFQRARALAGGDGLVVVTGSHFVVAEARAQVFEVDVDPPIAY